MPKVRTATYAGVCFGVKRALELLNEALALGEQESRPVLMFGPLIHNPRVIESYRTRGVSVVDRDGIRDHSVVVIRSHGITRDEERYLAKFTDLRIVDTTCPFVRRIHTLVTERSAAGWAIVVLGDIDHSEVQGFVSRIDGPYCVHPPAPNPAALKELETFLRNHDKFFAVAQTTSQPAHFKELLDRMGTVCHETECRFEHQNTVCDATYQRQNAALELARAVDAMVLIGGKNSSNTAKLYDIIHRENTNALWIEAPGEFTAAELAVLKQARTIGLTAGASTPDDQIADLAAYLEALAIVLRTDNPLHPDNFLRIDPAIGVPLWMEGMIEAADSRAIAIVGTRKPSLYGIELARNIATAAAKNGLTIVSGMARGIDTEAHRAALAAGGRTIAVLGTGLESLYPEENIALARDIAKNGAVLSQFPPETTPRPRNFPIRNATIALLSTATVIIEAGIRSGSLVTGRNALEAGRRVHVAAGPLDAESFRGNYEFLKKYEGNRLVSLLSSLDELFTGIPPVAALKKAAAPAIPLAELDPTEQVIVTALTGRNDSCSFDDIAETTGLPAATLPAVLLPLVLKGVVAEEPGNRYRIM